MEEILNNWLQEKPKDKFDKELHKYTYYDLMEFAENYHTLQLQQTGVIISSGFKKARIYFEDKYIEEITYESFSSNEIEKAYFFMKNNKTIAVVPYNYIIISIEN